MQTKARTSTTQIQIRLKISQEKNRIISNLKELFLKIIHETRAPKPKDTHCFLGTPGRYQHGQVSMTLSKLCGLVMQFDET